MTRRTAPLRSGRIVLALVTLGCVSGVPRASAEPAAAPDVLFDADVGHRGLSAYAAVVHRNRVAVVDDPVLGRARKVMRFTVYDSDTGPTADPRAQVETARRWGEGADIYVGFSLLLPRGWPAQLPQGGSSWLTLAEVYGPPYAGASPVKVGMGSGVPALSVQRNATYDWDVAWRKGPILTGRWQDFVIHERLSKDPAKGFFEIWTNTGSGWHQGKVEGRDRLYMRTLDASNGGGANYSALKLYRKAGMFPVLTCYFAEHRVARTFTAAAPHSYR